MNKHYIHDTTIHNLQDPMQVWPEVLKFIKPKSVLDVGCGTGTWLKALESFGINEYIGVDGDYVAKQDLVISHDKFIASDLKEPLQLNRRFDLVISLEVAEHLPESSADNFVKTLITHGEIVLFSAAIPNQGGQYHLNERWIKYWEEKFNAHGYYLHDIIRPLIWENERIHWWYRQNIFLITTNKNETPVLSLVHPSCFTERINAYEASYKALANGQVGLRQSGKIFIKALKQFLS